MSDLQEHDKDPLIACCDHLSSRFGVSWFSGDVMRPLNAFGGPWGLVPCWPDELFSASNTPARRRTAFRRLYSLVRRGTWLPSGTGNARDAVTRYACSRDPDLERLAARAQRWLFVRSLRWLRRILQPVLPDPPHSCAVLSYQGLKMATAACALKRGWIKHEGDFPTFDEDATTGDMLALHLLVEDWLDESVPQRDRSIPDARVQGGLRRPSALLWPANVLAPHALRQLRNNNATPLRDLPLEWLVRRSPLTQLLYFDIFGTVPPTSSVRTLLRRPPEFKTDLGAESELDSGNVPSELRQEFADHGHALSPSTSVSVVKAGVEWQLDSEYNNYLMHKNERALSIHKPRFEAWRALWISHLATSMHCAAISQARSYETRIAVTTELSLLQMEKKKRFEWQLGRTAQFHAELARLIASERAERVVLLAGLFREAPPELLGFHYRFVEFFARQVVRRSFHSARDRWKTAFQDDPMPLSEPIFWGKQSFHLGECFRQLLDADSSQLSQIGAGRNLGESLPVVLAPPFICDTSPNGEVTLEKVATALSTPRETIARWRARFDSLSFGEPTPAAYPNDGRGPALRKLAGDWLVEAMQSIGPADNTNR